MITYEQRNKLIDILIADMQDSVAGDAGFAYTFVKEVMLQGYKNVNDYSDEELLKWYEDAFNKDFLEEYANGTK